VGEPTSFLMQTAQAGHPTDYLLARIRRRRRDLLTDRTAPAQRQAESEQGASARGMTAREARRNMRQEFRWVYLQMDQGMRNTFASLFLWFELRTILISLRLQRTSGQGESPPAQEESLLAQRVLRVFSGVEAPFTGSDPLSELLQADAKQIRILGNWYREQKGREYEERFLALYLEMVSRQKLHPVLREFFSALVDLNNLLALRKQIRWQLYPPHPFIEGGTAGRKRLEKAQQEGEPGLLKLLRSQPGLSELSALPDNLEHLLLVRLTRKVEKLGADPLGIGIILAYLWECTIEARNASVVQHAALLGDETLTAELIG